MTRKLEWTVWARAGGQDTELKAFVSNGSQIIHEYWVGLFLTRTFGRKFQATGIAGIRDDESCFNDLDSAKQACQDHYDALRRHFMETKDQ